MAVMTSTHTRTFPKYKLIMTIEESIAELQSRLRNMGEEPATPDVVLNYATDAIWDAMAVLGSLDTLELIQIRNDPEWVYLQDGIIADPYEAFTFNVVEEITTHYLKVNKNGRGEVVRPRGINLTRLPLVTIHT